MAKVKRMGALLLAVFAFAAGVAPAALADAGASRFLGSYRL